MKITSISGILAAFFFPLVVLGQTETYTVRAVRFNSNKSDEFSPVYYKNGIVFCSNMNRNLFLNYQTPEDKGLIKINFADTALRKSQSLFKESEDEV